LKTLKSSAIPWAFYRADLFFKPVLFYGFLLTNLKFTVFTVITYFVFFAPLLSYAGVLHEAIGRGNIVEVLAAVKQSESAKNLNETDAQGNTALMLAAHAGKAEIVSLLIKNKAQLDIQNKKGQTALVLAIDHQQLEAAELLIQAGANVLLADTNELSPLKLAIAINNSVLIQSLGNKAAAKNLTPAQQFDLMAVCISLGQAQALDALLKIGLNPKTVTPEKMTLLMVIPMGYMSQKKRLLQEKKATTALLKNYTQMLDSLLAAGLNATAKDADGLTALDYVMGISAQSSKENASYTMTELFNLMQKKGIK
jgi:hypothetical protein